jgi:CheY-like chemotaxis protein/two-component sensor histidine kinase
MVFARRDKLEPQPVNLQALLAGMDDLLRQAAGPGARIEVEVASGLLPALADPTQTELALLNLVINARDAMAGQAQGRVTIAVQAADLEAGNAMGLAPGAYLRLSVSDTGVGMTPQVRERAIEPFFTTKPLGQGTGLGLSMVHGFVSQSGGALRIESEPGRGTKVSLHLPGASATGPNPAGADGAIPSARQPANPARVLLVDDDASTRLMLAVGLREAGHAVTEAPDAEAALAALREGTLFDVLVTDYAMPGMNGALLAKAACALRPSLPVILMTGHAAESMDALKRVADAVLRKPFTPEDLELRIEALRLATAVQPLQ